MKVRVVKSRLNELFLIPIGDLHVGEKAFNEESLKKIKGYVNWVKNKKNVYVFLMGDLINCATLESPSSPFQQNMNLQEQIESVVDLFTPIKKRIIGAITGNHESRLENYAGYNPTIPICNSLGCYYFGYDGVVLFRMGCHGKDGLRHPRATFSVYFHHCFDEKTEILTRKGWKKYIKISTDDEALTLNIETGNMEWNKINEIYVWDDFDRMIHYKSKTCDLMVTEDHTLINKSRNNNKYFKAHAIDLFGKDNNFPCSGVNPHKDYPIRDELLQLIAWVLTEGTTFKNKVHEIRITQSDKPKVGKDRILKIIERLEDEYSIKTNVRLKYKKGVDKNGFKRNYDAYEIYINKCDLSKKIREIVPDKKIPNWFFKLSKRQFDLLLFELLLGDGTTDKRDGCHNFSYSQKNKKEIDKLQALCALNGYRTVLGQQPDETYRLSITRRTTHRVKSKDGTREPYSGSAWCVSVDNKTLVVRRNGKVTITGNTTGGGSTIGGKINRADKLRDVVCDADAYCGAHNHLLGCVHTGIFKINPTTEKIEWLRQMIIDTGGYLNYEDSYANMKQLPPAKLGSPKIRFYIKRDGKDNVHKDIHVSL